jgi:excisionase family DNA binding protein
LPDKAACWAAEGSAAVTADGTSGLMVPAEVAALFGVDPKTVTRWARSGRLSSIKTPGGHHRYRATEVHALLAELAAAAHRPGREGNQGGAEG